MHIFIDTYTFHLLTQSILKQLKKSEPIYFPLVLGQCLHLLFFHCSLNVRLNFRVCFAEHYKDMAIGYAGFYCRGGQPAAREAHAALFPVSCGSSTHIKVCVSYICLLRLVQ